MDLVEVQSSNIAAIGYDQETKMLRVRFRSGAEHDYPEISKTVFDEFMAAPRKGKYFASRIRCVTRQQRPRKSADGNDETESGDWGFAIVRR